ncbi:MAG: hypothetical protein ACE3JQ_12305 [Paenisporosarcina sp.]
MTKKKLWMIAVGVPLLSVIIIYWFYFSKPAAFPENNQLLKSINQMFPEVTENVIQETIFLDEHHAYVPFMSEAGNYGMSFWVWEKHKWNVDSINTSGHPHLWKIDENDPSTYYFVWNIRPDEQVEYMKLFMKKDRAFHITDGIEEYTTGIQMEHKVLLSEESYGVSQLSKDWVSVIDSHLTNLKGKQPNMFFNTNIPEHTLYFGWTSFNDLDRVTFGNSTNSSSIFRSGNERIEFVRILDKLEIE